MSQVTITGKVVAAQQLFTSSSGTFQKQTVIVEVVNGNYTSYFPVDFTNQDIQNFLNSGQVQMGHTYQITGYLQGSGQQVTDKNGQPTAYLNIKATAVAPAQSQMPQTAQATAPQAQGGFVGPSNQPQQCNAFGAPQPAAQQPQGFGQPAAPSQPNQAQGFGNQPQQGFGNSAPAPAPNQGFGNAPNNGGGFGQGQ